MSLGSVSIYLATCVNNHIGHTLKLWPLYFLKENACLGKSYIEDRFLLELLSHFRAQNLGPFSVACLLCLCLKSKSFFAILFKDIIKRLLEIIVQIYMKTPKCSGILTWRSVPESNLLVIVQKFFTCLYDPT